MPHRVINHDPERARWQLFQDSHLTLELLLFLALIRVVKELGVQVVHDKVADLDHVEVQLLIVTQKLISLQLTPRDLEQFLE